MSYNAFSSVYDSLMQGADYKARTEYLLNIFNKFGKMPTLLLDVACGTGSFSVELAKSGIQVIGADPSPEMLAVAKEKAENSGQDILFLCQAAQELDLYGTVNGAVCCMDSINHITNYKTLVKAFKKISLFLEPDCLFVFDVNTVYKHKTVLGNNTFVLEEDNVFCTWQNNTNNKTLTTEITLDFFTKNGKNYVRTTESFCERAYTKQQLNKALTAAGFKIEAIYGENTFNPPKPYEQRVVYVLRKVNNG